MEYFLFFIEYFETSQSRLRRRGVARPFFVYNKIANDIYQIISAMLSIFQLMNNSPVKIEPKQRSNIFRQPFSYLVPTDIHLLEKEVIEDLELIETKNENSTPIAEILYEPKTTFAKKMIEPMTNSIVSNRDFIVSTKHFLQNIQIFRTTERESNSAAPTDDNILEIYNILNNPEFIENYYYIEWKQFDYLNESESIMQILSMVNGVIPISNIVFSLFIPFMPLIILSLTNQSITYNNYISCLSELGKKQAVSRLLCFLNPSLFSLQNIFSIILFIIIFGYQIYFSYFQVQKFYKDLSQVITQLNDLRAFLRKQHEQMMEYIVGYGGGAAANHSAYNEFFKEMKSRATTISEILSLLSRVVVPDKNEKWLSFKTIDIFQTMGYHFKVFYQLHKNEHYMDTIHYSMDFSGFYENWRNLASKISTDELGEAILGEVSDADFGTSDTESLASETESEVSETESEVSDTVSETPQRQQPTIFKGLYHPSIENPVVNNIYLKNPMIISGPNASGKTTLLKAALINVIFSQQVGYGYYRKAIIPNLYQHIHSYVNIPDTSDRDSLFQAETRRCKKILKEIEKAKNSHHLCIFDELFSATNPTDAAESGYTFLKHLAEKYNRVDFMMTTHYEVLCRKVDATETRMKTFCMKTKKENNKTKMFYTVGKGISVEKNVDEILNDIGLCAAETSGASALST